MADPTVPVVSGGERTTTSTVPVDGVDGTVATCSRAPRVRARDAVETGRAVGAPALRRMSVRERLERIADAGRRFEGIGPADDGAADRYRRLVARSTGLPIAWVRRASHWLGYGLRHMPETLRAQSPTGGLDVYDDPAYEREETVGLAFAPRVDVLGCVMPANTPTVYGWPAVALAMGVPVVLRPSDREPFTAVRLARALLAAGVPEAAVHVLPAEQSVGRTIVRAADHALVFGDAATVADYRDDPAVEAYGPGRSVAVVGADPSDDQVRSLARGVCHAGGRACLSLSRVVATGDCDPEDLAKRLGEAVADRPVGSVLDGATEVPVLVDGDRADAIASALVGTGRDVTASGRDGERVATTPDGPAVRPTVVRTDDLLAEYPAPVVGVTARDRSALPEVLDRAYLAVTVGDPVLERRLVRSPTVRHVYGGRYPAAIDLRRPHETYPASFLYERTAYEPA